MRSQVTATWIVTPSPNIARMKNSIKRLWKRSLSASIKTKIKASRMPRPRKLNRWIPPFRTMNPGRQAFFQAPVIARFHKVNLAWRIFGRKPFKKVMQLWRVLKTSVSWVKTWLLRETPPVLVSIKNLYSNPLNVSVRRTYLRPRCKRKNPASLHHPSAT